jgi:hypothetical protein
MIEKENTSTNKDKEINGIMTVLLKETHIIEMTEEMTDEMIEGIDIQSQDINQQIKTK